MANANSPYFVTNDESALRGNLGDGLPVISEGLDWVVYTTTKRPLRDRILLSSAIGTPIDSIVFTAMIGILSPMNVVVMTASKMLSAVAVWLSLKRSSAV